MLLLALDKKDRAPVDVLNAMVYTIEYYFWLLGFNKGSSRFIQLILVRLEKSDVEFNGHSVFSLHPWQNSSQSLIFSNFYF